ncbi:hypothetical protein OSTOST_02767 [Ostertagia ostertagi]
MRKHRNSAHLKCIAAMFTCWILPLKHPAHHSLRIKRRRGKEMNKRHFRHSAAWTCCCNMVAVLIGKLKYPSHFSEISPNLDRAFARFGSPILTVFSCDWISTSVICFGVCELTIRVACAYSAK